MASVAGTSVSNAQKAAHDAANRFHLSAESADVKQQNGSMKHGEVEFTGLGGHRAKYLIVPPYMEDADEILRWMFTHPKGWQLKMPNLILKGFGGRDHYVNWPDSATLKNRQTWQASVGETMEDWKFRKRFLSRLGEISGGIVQAVSECGGWFDFGTASRGGLNEVLKDGMKVYWSATASLAGHKNSCVAFGIKQLDTVEFAEQFIECAVDCDPPKNAVEQTAVQKRVMYPSVDHKIFPEIVSSTDEPPEEVEDGTGSKFEDLDPEVKHAVTARFLCNALTHVVFCQNPQVADKLKEKLKELSTRAVILANGRIDTIEPGINGTILQEASIGTSIICLNNTGGAAEMLGHAVLQRRNPALVNTSLVYNYSLPENIPDEQILILNPAKDSVEKVINKLTLVLSTVQDAEMSAVGYIKSEQQRLVYAWEMIARFEHNAKRYRLQARIFFYTTAILAVVLTFVAYLHNRTVMLGGDDPFEAGHDAANLTENAVRRLFPEPVDQVVDYFPHTAAFWKLVLLVLPILNAFLLTLINRRNPLSKWATLESARVHTLSELYQYRCRVMDYMPRKNANVDVHEKIESLCDSPPQQENAEAAIVASMMKKKQADKTSAKKRSRRGLFGAELERINCEALGSDLRSDHLVPPPQRLLKQMISGLYNSVDVKHCWRVHKFGVIGAAVTSCCTRSALNSEAYVKMDDLWDTVGADYVPNPNLIEDEFLKDDGVSLITAEDYVQFRLLPLLHYFHHRSRRLATIHNTMQTMTYVLAAATSAATIFEKSELVPCLVALVSFIQAILEFENVSVQLRNVNQSLERLQSLRLWWLSLSMVERRLISNKETLVMSAEGTIDAEISAWKKSMGKLGAPAKSGKEDEDDEGAVERTVA